MERELKLGVGRTDITPAIGGHLYGYTDHTFSDSIHDSLSATAFVLQQDDKQAVLISATVCLIQTVLAKRICQEIETRFGIPKEHIILSATHTHAGPNTAANIGWGDLDVTYCETIFIPQILKAVEIGLGRLVSVTMGVSQGMSDIAVNRRQVLINNKVKLGQNPSGPYDPRMTILSFKDDEGHIVGNIVHYGLHGTAAGHLNTAITKDWSGVMTERLESLTGAVTAFFNGPEGDVGPRLTNGKTTGTLSMMRELGGIAASDAVRIYQQAKVWQIANLQCYTGKIRVPLDSRIDFEEAKELLEKIIVGKDNWETRNKAHLEEIIASYKEGYEEQEYEEHNQTIIQLGDVAFVSFPYEIFSEIGMRIARESKAAYTLSLSNTNGSEGYFVTQDAICRGGYEVEMHKNARIQPYADDADWHIIKDTIKNLEEMRCTE